LDFTYYTSTYKDENGKTLMYAVPSNLSPASEEFEDLVAKRVQMLRKANPDMEETTIPVELATCSGSGLDQHISPLKRFQTSAHLYTILISKQTYLRPFNTNKDRIKKI